MTGLEKCPFPTYASINYKMVCVFTDENITRGDLMMTIDRTRLQSPWKDIIVYDSFHETVSYVSSFHFFTYDMLFFDIQQRGNAHTAWSQTHQVLKLVYLSRKCLIKYSLIYLFMLFFNYHVSMHFIIFFVFIYCSLSYVHHIWLSF